MKKMKKKTKNELILSHVNHTFFMLDPRIGPHTFKHIQFTLGKSVFCNVKKGSIQGPFCFKLVLGSLDPCLK